MAASLPTARRLNLIGLGVNEATSGEQWSPETVRGVLHAADFSVDSPKSVMRLLAAYTSFDGDHIADVARMCLATSMLDYLPLNPEAALGYFVSTVHLGNRKSEVMKACLAVEFKADELWLITDGSPNELASLPEGVVAEYLLWRAYYPDAPVRQFPWLNDAKWRDELDTGSRPRRALLDDALLVEADHQQIIDGLDEAYLLDLEDSLLRSAREEGLPRVVYLCSDEAEDKHVDWARRFAYESGCVGFAPSTIVPKFVHDVLGRDAQDRAEYRHELIGRADEFWLLARPKAIAERDFPEAILNDLAAWTLAHPDEGIRALTWADLGVPKYDPSSSWALTRREAEEDS